MDFYDRKLEANPKTTANPISRLFILWILPLLNKGRKKDLDFDDLYSALPEDSSAKLGNAFEKEWIMEVARANPESGRQPKLWRVIRNIIWKRYLVISLIFSFDELVLRTFQPLILRNFIRTFREHPEHIDEDKMKEVRRDQYIYAALLVFVTVCFAIIFQNLISLSMHLGMKCRLGISSLIYRKVLKLRKSDSEQANVGRLCNLLSSDVNRLDQGLNLLSSFWIAPMQLVIFTYLLWNELGIAAFGGMGCILIILPILVLVGRFSMYFRTRISKRTDERGRFLNEIIGGIRLIKMYAWEKPFAVVVSKLRRAEIKFIRRHLYLRGMYVSLHSISSKLIPFCALILYVALGNTLTADKAFFSVSVFNIILQAVMNRFPNAASQLGELLASLNRIESFLLSKDNTSYVSGRDVDLTRDIIKEDEIKSSEAAQKIDTTAQHLHFGGSNEPCILMDNYTASWSEEGPPVLKDLTVELMGKQLVMVVGHVGCGKSSFLNAILSELPFMSTPDGGRCLVQGRLSYASQEAWIFPATLRQNILFGLQMDKERYSKVIRMSCLLDDLKQFPDGDLSLVGERGVALSGGQKARVNLARALYHEADIYLLDDPLSAVDTRVSKQLFNECIKEYLKGKLRILVTHQLQYLPLADHIIVLSREGGLWAQGTYDELVQSGIDFTSLISTEHLNGALKEDLVNENEEPDATGEQDKQGDDNRSMSRSRSGTPSERGEGERNRLLSQSPVLRKMKEETKEIGSVGFKTYFRYYKSGGSILTMIFLLFAFLTTQALTNGVDYWISLWTNTLTNDQKNSTKPSSTVKESFGTESDENVLGIVLNSFISLVDTTDQKFYGNVYCGMMIVFVLINILRSISFFRYCMKISINLHHRMFGSVVRATVKFFDDNPSGRIMNRFTKDLNHIDEQLPLAFYDFVTVYLALLGMLVLNVIANYYVAVPAVLLLLSLWSLRRLYLATARDLKRIESVAKSPMFTHVTTTVQGLITIRSLKADNRVLDQFEKIQDIHTSAYYLMFITGRCFAIWLEMFSSMFLAIVTFGFLLLTTSSAGGNVGVAITSILGLTGALQWGIRQSAETENYMTSVERAFEYCNLKPEAELETDNDDNLKESWPKEGKISFNSVSLAYDELQENAVLKNVTFFLHSKEKVGIVGRTGAGKSSLITALFRLTELCHGEIIIDGVDIKDIGLHTLRSKISIIPQDPVLFTGTLRYNLDPFQEFSDDELYRVLQEVDLHHAVPKLDCQVADGGSNFSTGQRQLVCLARSILRKNRIIVLDEATANVDPATDELVQKTIQAKFSDCTILVIAHRLQTIIDNDRIMVLEAGKVVEFDRPQVLMDNEDGAFSAMLKANSK